MTSATDVSCDAEVVDALIPARNEADRIGQVVEAVASHPKVAKVIVVDNASGDGTGSVAAAAGAYVVGCERVGLGHAIKEGLKAVESEFVLKTDGDILNWQYGWVDALLPASPSVLSRGVFQSPYDSFPVTRLVAEPFFEIWNPGSPIPPRALSGTYCFQRDLLGSGSFLSDDWSFEVSLLCYAISHGIDIVNVDLGMLHDRERDMDHYVPMARDIIRFFLSKGAGPRR